jgi:dipeptidase E
MVSGNTKNVLFIGTASGDAEGYIEAMQTVFTGLGCDEVKALELTRKEYTAGELRSLFSWADIIYVGGGDTVFMRNEWKKHGVDVLLREVYEQDTAVLMGISAGAMCWFDCGCTDSELVEIKPGMKFGLAEELLGIYPQMFCPHYEDRVDDFAELLKDKQRDGLAPESNVAFVEENGVVYFIKSEEKAKAYEFCYENGSYKKKELEVKYLG